jgi:hypothetical protein
VFKVPISVFKVPFFVFIVRIFVQSSKEEICPRKHAENAKKGIDPTRGHEIRKRLFSGNGYPVFKDPSVIIVWDTRKDRGI